MSSHICNFCQTSFISKTNLLNHQEKAKYCIKLRGKEKKKIKRKLNAQTVLLFS